VFETPRPVTVAVLRNVVDPNVCELVAKVRTRSRVVGKEPKLLLSARAHARAITGIYGLLAGSIARCDILQGFSFLGVEVGVGMLR
jgi:hypothetical protein